MSNPIKQLQYVENQVLTDEEKRIFIESDGGCPICGSYNIDCTSQDGDGNMKYSRYMCADCHTQWEKTYTLSDVALIANGPNREKWYKENGIS